MDFTCEKSSGLKSHRDEGEGSEINVQISDAVPAALRSHWTKKRKYIHLCLLVLACRVVLLLFKVNLTANKTTNGKRMRQKRKLVFSWKLPC